MPTAEASVTEPESSIIFLEGGRLQAAPVLGKGSSNYRIAFPAGQQRRLPIAKALAEVETPGLERLLAAAEAGLARLNVSELHRRCDGKRLSSEQLARLAFDEAKPAALLALKAALVVDPGFFVSQGDLHQPVPAAQAQAVVEGRRRREQAAQRQQRFLAGLKQGKIDEKIAAAALAFIEKKHDPAEEAFRILRKYSCDAKVPIQSLVVRWGLVADEHELHLRMALADIPASAPAAGSEAEAVLELDDLPLLAEDAFSIDGAGTIEIDDAFSACRTDAGCWQIGIHIAAPALGLPAAAARQAEQRMTSVYLPDRKIMQFPESDRARLRAAGRFAAAGDFPAAGV